MKLKSANSSMKFNTQSSVFKAWNSGLQAKKGDNTIDILDVIDADWGVGAASVKARLSEIGDKKAVVQINSPGGDLYEGIAIYNLLKEHRAGVEVQILGLAASAASIIAMAGDEIEVMTGAQIMIHNAWSMAWGNKHDMAAAGEFLTEADGLMREIYKKRANLSDEKLIELMDGETFLNGEKSMELGFATSFGGEKPKEGASALSSVRAIEAALRAQGYTRTEQREFINELKSTRDATGEPSTRDAAENVDLSATLRIAANLKSLL